MSATETDARRIIGHIDGGRVLDVATGRGGFIAFLAEGLADYDEIVGVDVDGSRRDDFEAATLGRRGVRFEEVDILHQPPAAGSFDTVAMSASLHHFLDPVGVLGIIDGLVRPGGWIVIAEMYRDDQTAPQMTEVLVHDWMAEVDAALGVPHRPTHRRAEIIRLVDGLALRDLRLYDIEPERGPHDTETSAALEAAIARTVERADGLPALQAQADELRARLAQVGVQDATILVEVGRVAGP